jgi:hypothetical protein
MDAIGGLGKSTSKLQSRKKLSNPLAVYSGDELRMLTDVGTAQEGEVIPVYLSQKTFDSVDEMFPYLTDKSRATGGGFVSSLDFRIFQMNGDGVGPEDSSLEVCGVKVIPLEGRS